MSDHCLVVQAAVGEPAHLGAGRQGRRCSYESHGRWSGPARHQPLSANCNGPLVTLIVPIDRDSPMPLTHQTYEFWRAGIVSGRFPARRACGLDAMTRLPRWVSRAGRSRRRTSS